MHKKIVILASGSGSNAERIITYFKSNKLAQVSLVVTNNPSAGVLERCKRLKVPTLVVSREDFYSNHQIVRRLATEQPDLIVLAGFLWLVPKSLIQAFPRQIINIHPALLPKYGGKGMYGQYVHEAVVANQESKSGITIHFVNESYDEGDIIYQAETCLTKEDTPGTLAGKIHQLEYQHFPLVIQQVLGH